MKAQSYLLGIVVGLSLLVTACGKSRNRGGLHDGIGGSEVVLKFRKGYLKMNASEIRAVTITIKAVPPSNAAPSIRRFTGAKVPTLLGTLGLHKPSEPGAAAAVVTGSVTLQFKSAEVATRTLNIMNSRLIADSSFQEAYYHPSEVLDKSWLEKQ